MSASRTRAALVAALLLAAAACSEDPLTIEGLAGEYVLVAADGRGLPATIISTDSLVVEVTGGDLLMLDIAEYSLDVDFRLSDPRSSADPTTETFIDVGPWDIGDGLIMFQSTRPNTFWFGEVNGSEITIGIGEPDFIENRVDLTYRRVSGG
jgi:hypothetical protein